MLTNTIPNDEKKDNQNTNKKFQNESIKIVTSLNVPHPKNINKKAKENIASIPKIRENFRSKKFIQSQNKKIQEFKLSSNEKILKDTLNNKLLKDHKKKNITEFKATEIKYDKYQNINLNKKAKDKKQKIISDNSSFTESITRKDFNNLNLNFNLEDTLSFINDNSIDLIASYLNMKGIKLKKQSTLKRIKDSSSSMESITNKKTTRQKLKKNNANNNMNNKRNTNKHTNSPNFNNKNSNTKRKQTPKLSSIQNLNSNPNKISSLSSYTNSKLNNTSSKNNNIKTKKNNSINYNKNSRIGDVFFSVSDKKYKLSYDNNNNNEKKSNQLHLNDKIKSNVNKNIYQQNPYKSISDTQNKFNNIPKCISNKFRIYKKNKQKNMRLYTFTRKDGKILIKSSGEIKLQNFNSSKNNINSKNKNIKKKKSLLQMNSVESVKNLNNRGKRKNHKKKESYMKDTNSSTSSSNNLANSESFSSFNNIIIKYKKDSTDSYSSLLNSTESLYKNLPPSTYLSSSNDTKKLLLEDIHLQDSLNSLSLQKRIKEYKQTMKNEKNKSNATPKNNILNEIDWNKTILEMSKTFDNKINNNNKVFENKNISEMVNIIILISILFYLFIYKIN